jgi:hypothetical protein
MVQRLCERFGHVPYRKHGKSCFRVKPDGRNPGRLTLATNGTICRQLDAHGGLGMTGAVIWRSNFFACVGALLWVGCGGAQPAEPAPPPASPTEATAPANSEVAEPAPAQPVDTTEPPAAKLKFDDLAPADKLNLMKTVVAPEMAKVFQSLDAEHYEDFGCKTCHGPGVKEGKFDMPSEALPKLPKNIGEVFKSQPDMAKFMAEKVLPKMAEILGEEPFDPETHQGFGCLACHQQQ